MADACFGTAPSAMSALRPAAGICDSERLWLMLKRVGRFGRLTFWCEWCPYAKSISVAVSLPSLPATFEALLAQQPRKRKGGLRQGERGAGRKAGRKGRGARREIPGAQPRRGSKPSRGGSSHPSSEPGPRRRAEARPRRFDFSRATPPPTRARSSAGLAVLPAPVLPWWRITGYTRARRCRPAGGPRRVPRPPAIPAVAPGPASSPSFRPRSAGELMAPLSCSRKVVQTNGRRAAGGELAAEQKDASACIPARCFPRAQAALRGAEANAARGRRRVPHFRGRVVTHFGNVVVAATSSASRPANPRISGQYRQSSIERKVLRIRLMPFNRWGMCKP